MIFNLNNISKNTAVYKAYIRLANNLAKDQPVFFEKYSTSIRSADFVICANIWHVLFTWFYLLGSKAKIIFWVQGVIAEESYLKHNSKFKFYLLKLLEKICLYFSDAYIYVSPYMMEFYSKNKSVRNKPALIFPCISDLRHNSEIERDSNNYCYIGGMSKWQNFEKIIQIMNLLVNSNQQANFSIATNDLSICRDKIDHLASDQLKKVISLVSLSSKQEIEDFLSKAAYGFLIRDDIIVNNVASPIKLAEYFSCGVNVISTKGVTSYVNLIRQAGFIIDEKNIESLKTINFKCDEKAALKVFKENFNENSLSDSIDLFFKEIGLLKQ